MSAPDLTQTFARFGDSPVHPIVIESWQRSRAAGLDREAPPDFRTVAPADLQRRQSESRALLDVAIPHLRWLSRWFQQRPHVAYIVDRDGVVIHAEGDPVAIDRYHLSPGHDWSESSMGTNGAGTALAAGVPVAVVGCDHWSAAWKDATCLGAPIHGPDGRPLAAIDISLDLQPGDADRLVVVAHVAYTISQELARREAESRTEATEALYEAVRAALDAEQRARTETEAALARARAADAGQRESQARLTLALDGAAMGMWELDLATETCTWSEQTATLFGLPRGATSLPLTRFLDLIHPDDRDAVRQAKASAAAGATYDVEFRAIWPDGTVHWINGKGQVGPTPDGQGLRLIGIGQDITARKEQEAALRLSERRLQAIVDSTPALVYVVDAEGRFRLINRRFAELFALEPSAVIGRPLTEYFPPESADQFTVNNRHVLDSGDVCEFEEVVDLGGDLRTFISVKAPLVDEAGAPYAVCGVSTDITERKRLMSALELAQRQKDAFVATVAHELRQPIAAIGAALAVMQTRAGREMGERARTIADRQVRQLARIVDDLLDAARIAQGKVTLHRERIPLRQVLEAAVSVVQPLVQQRSQQLEVHLPADTLWLDADAARLQQVFSNLLTNAVKFTGPAGRITVSVEPAPDIVAVRIRDTGRGIAPDALPHIFDLFTQAAPDGHGLGIGLAVVRRLVERHGGTVEGRSEGPETGSEFIVRLPPGRSVEADTARLLEPHAAVEPSPQLLVPEAHPRRPEVHMRVMDVRLSIVIAAAAAQLAVLDVRPALAGDALYFSAYEDIRSRLVSRIRAEQVRLDVAVWYLTDRAVSKAIADKYRSGVPVRVLGDRVSIFENDGNTRREFEYLATSGVPIRVRYHPTWFPRAMHWKAAIFVGQNVVEFGSANFTSFELKPWSTTNYHDEVAFFTTDRAILNAFKTQFDRFWADTTSFMDFDDAYEREVGEPFPVRVVVDRARLEPDYPKPSTIVWGQGAELSARMVAEIQRETAFIHMVVFRLTDARITEALLERRRAGVPVRVIIEPAEYNRRTYPEYEMTRAQIDRLWAGGVAVRQRAHAGLTHMKTLITSRVALIASSNFTNNWQRDHNYFLPQSAKPALHLEMRNRFRAMWRAVVSVNGLPPAFRGFSPRPPAAAQLMGPAAGAVRVSRTPRLQWRRAAWAVAYDVYAGTSPTSLRFMGRVPAVVSENPPATYSWSPPAPFAARTTVYWRVVSRTNATPRSPKMIARSTVWSFTTE